MTQVNELINQALTHHQAGHLNQASDLYEQVLRENSSHPDALHLLGLVYHQKKDPLSAITYIQKAIDQNESASLYHSNLGNVYREINEIDKAVECFQKAIELEPGFAGAHYNLAMSYESMGKTEEAVSSYEEAIQNNPQFMEALNNLGKLYSSIGNFERATRCFEYAVKLNPTSAYLYFNLGNALAGDGELEKAIENYLTALDFDPNSSDILNNLGSTYKELKDFEQAEYYLKKAVECVEVNPETYNNLGSLYMDMGQSDRGIKQFQNAVTQSPESPDFRLNLGRAFKESHQLQEAADQFDAILLKDQNHQEACFQMGDLLLLANDCEKAIEFLNKALELGREDHVIYNTLGNCHLKAGRQEKAEEYFEKAIEANPEHGTAYHNLGCLCIVQGDFPKALEYTLKALQINPDYQIAVVNEGIILKELGKLDEARESFHRALALEPGDSNVLLQISLLDLLEGDWEKGWANYHHRWSQVDQVRNLPKPEWNGEFLSGKSLLIHAEQGLGDEIMFASCFPEIMDLAGKCIIECNSRLVSIFKRTFLEAEIIPHPVPTGEEAREFWDQIDYRLPVASCARHVRKCEADFPEQESFLIPDPELCSYWKEKLDSLPGQLKIGISWKSVAQKKRDMSLEDWKQILEREDVSLINLQYGDVKEDIEKLDPELAEKIHSFDEIDPLKELDHFSALISELDLVISIDNSTVHLSGALGTETWALLPAVSSWRWLKERRDTLWYSSVELFRQKIDEDWTNLFSEIDQRLNDYDTKKGSNPVDSPAERSQPMAGTIEGKESVILAATSTEPKLNTESNEYKEPKEIPDDVAREKKKYEKMWEVDQYRRFSPGLEDSLRINFLKEFKEMSVRSILDAGCGSGKLMQRILTEYSDDFTIHGFDISDNCLDPFFDSMKDEILTTGCLWNPEDMTEKFDAVVCTDVLEHIPTHKIPDVLTNLKNSMKIVGFFSIALFDDHFGPNTLGEPLHLTVKKPNWWFAQISLTGMQIAGQRVERNQQGMDLWLHLYVLPPKSES